MAKESIDKTEKKLRVRPPHLFKPGAEWKGNIHGRPLGTLNFMTDFREALKRIRDKSTGEAITEIDIIYKYLQQSLGGDTKLLDKLVDRLYGKAVENINLNGSMEVGEKSKVVSQEAIDDYLKKRDANNKRLSA